MNTQEMLDVAVKLAGLEECPADAAVIVPGDDVKNVLAGIDMNTPELLVAKMMGYDCVVSHHPRNTNLKGMNDLFRAQMYTMNKNGVPLNEAQKLIETRASKMESADHAFNFNRNASAAEVLGLPFLCIHTPADVIVEKALQKLFDERFGDKPKTKVGELLKVFDDIPEYKQAIFPPKIAVGSPDSYAGRILVIMSGVTGGGPDVYKAYFRAGVGTLVLMHAGEEDIKAVGEQKVGNIIVAGHMSSDSYGMNRIIEVWEQSGVKVTRMSGLLNPS
jgi:putative NIF3 family GTP cyclohydrolase 1 type 2